MTDQQTFELRLADAFARYVQAAPTSVDPAALAAAVLSAPGARRRPIVVAWWASPNRRLLLIGLVALLAAALLGLSAGGFLRPRVTPLLSDSSPAPFASSLAVTATPLPAGLAGRWIGPPKGLPGLVPGAGAVIDLESAEVGLYAAWGDNAASTAIGPNAMPLGQASVAGGQLRFETRAADASVLTCDAGAVGQYPYSVSANGRSLTLGTGTDTCSAREKTLPGTWQLIACGGETDSDFCLGVLDAGTYVSAEALRGYGNVTYTVPPGWANYTDGGGFGLTPADDLAKVRSGGPTPGTTIDVDVWLGVVQQDSCPRVAVANAPQTVDGILAAWSRLPGLTVSAPTRLEVGGHPATFVDIALDRPTVHPCDKWSQQSMTWPYSSPWVEYTPAGGIDGLRRQRLILIDTGQKTQPNNCNSDGSCLDPPREILLGIRIEVPNTQGYEARIAAATQIVEQFKLQFAQLGAP